MKKTRLFAIALAAIAILAGCKKDPTPSSSENTKPCVLKTPTHVTFNTVTLNAVSLMPEEPGSTYYYGFFYSSTDPNPYQGKPGVNEIKITSLTDGDKFSSSVPGLEPDTDLFYKAYVNKDGEYYYSLIGRTKTKSLSIKTLDATDVTVNSAVIRGKLSVEEFDASASSIWFLYSDQTSKLDELKTIGKRIEVNKPATEFSVPVDKLWSLTTYYYVVCANIEDYDICGEVIAFKTKLPTTPSVDLGLSVDWASCNVRADKPKDCGGRYLWAGYIDYSDGETGLTYKYCPYCKVTTTQVFFSKYVTSSAYYYWCGEGEIDNKTELELMDDVANIKLGGKWRMPTAAEWDELLDKCSYSWVYYDGTTGGLFRSKVPNHEDMCIFLPAGGELVGWGPAEENTLAGYYWSSSLYLNSVNEAVDMCFKVDASPIMEHQVRYRGMTVRPVLPK